MKKLSFLFLVILLGIVGGGIVCKGASISAPSYNPGNFPEYDTSGNTIYYFGKDATPFYGFLGSTEGKCWHISMVFPINSYIRQDDAFNYMENSYDDKSGVLLAKINNSDKKAIITKTVVEEGSDSSYPWTWPNTHFWIPSIDEWTSNTTLINHYDDFMWTTYRSSWYSSTSGGTCYYNYYVHPYGRKAHYNDDDYTGSYSSYSGSGQKYCSAVLVMSLNLNKVIKVKPV